MQTIELTADNIQQYLERCINIQEYLASNPAAINSNFFCEAAGDTHAYFVAVVEDDRVLGMGLVGKLTHPANITGYINNIVVHPDARGKGLFGVIMDALEDKAKEWGCTDLALTCSREVVQGMYEKRGYTHKETNFYIRKDW